MTSVYKVENELQLETIRSYYRCKGRFSDLSSRVEKKVEDGRFPFYIAYSSTIIYNHFLVDEVTNLNTKFIKEFPFAEAIAYIKSMSAVEKVKADLKYAEEELEISTILMERALRLMNYEEE